MGFLIYISETVVVKYLYIAEALMLLLMLYLILFYRKIVKPMNTIGSGMELLREQDFSSRLSHVGQQEADRVVNVFNRMMEQLKNERLRLREQNHFLDLMINASPMGVIIMTLDEEVSQLNPMAMKMMGVRPEEAEGRKLSENFAVLYLEAVQRFGFVFFTAQACSCYYNIGFWVFKRAISCGFFVLPPIYGSSHKI